MPAVVQRDAPRAPALDARVVQRRADRMLVELGVQGAELSVLLTDDAHIFELNARHRRKRKPTDVLAFPMAEAAGEPLATGRRDDERSAPSGTPRLLGDVVISLDTAQRQARARRHGLLDEVTHLLAHGLLHLLGYDHRTDAEERRMNGEAARLVRAVTSRNAPAPKAVPGLIRSRITSRAR